MKKILLILIIPAICIISAIAMVSNNLTSTDIPLAELVYENWLGTTTVDEQKFRDICSEANADAYRRISKDDHFCIWNVSKHRCPEESYTPGFVNYEENNNACVVSQRDNNQHLKNFKILDCNSREACNSVCSGINSDSRCYAVNKGSINPNMIFYMCQLKAENKSQCYAYDKNIPGVNKIGLYPNGECILLTNMIEMNTCMP